MSLEKEQKEQHFECGTILLTISNVSKKKTYALTCIYCGFSVPYMNNFVQHLEDVHQENINALLVGSKETITDENASVETRPSLSNITQDPLIIDVKIEPPDIQSDESMESSSSDDNGANSDNEVCAKENNSQIDGFNKTIPTNEIKLLTEIIQLYECHPLLWNINNPDNNNRNKRENAFKKITTKVNEKFDGTIDWKIICKHINKLRYKFRVEQKKLQDKSINNEDYTPPWFYEKLLFLKDHLQLKHSFKEKDKMAKVTKFAHSLKGLNDEQILQLIEIYKSFPILWDVEHIEYRFRQVRRMKINELLTRVNDEMKLQMTLIELRSKIKAIRAIAMEKKELQLKDCKEATEIKGKFYKDVEFLINNIQPFHCNNCGENFQYIDSYKIHIAKHNDTNPFNCASCSRSFTNSTSYTDHLRAHIQPYECTECSKRFSTRTNRDKHMRCHTGEKPYFCEICGKSFRTTENMRRHVWRHKKLKKHKCRLCDKAFYDASRLRDHMNGHWNLRNNVCKTCNKSFTSLKYLRQHELIHAEQKRYVCNICGKAFAQYGGLSGHLKSHGAPILQNVGDESFMS